MQGAAFCFANLFVQVSINSFGAFSTAGSTIAMNFEYFVYYIITAFGQTATTFTGQNYAANHIERCKRILKYCLFFSFLCSTLVVIPLVLFRATVSGLFSIDPVVIENSCLRIVYILALEPICSIYETLAGVLRGCGHASEPAIAALTGTCVFRILWIRTVFRYLHKLPVLFAVFPISWIITIAFMWIVFIRIKPFDLSAFSTL